ncbi:putative component of NuA3 histone acetyltransferase complex [Ophidiomyces ophidiicola]|uniref:Component of NuA3 histone acetyltransferase complex n=1 Tax=Ophidiomyces ophidiicola TaxID=1387563 RepID=A0ACB8UPE3_9EURO|nr:putative component of NuA3 histone acetyltransferase complex [Ophidiomyces ophidiicola]KAI1922607.1 putative component of NuA3 histone acetyltransferase complex [Ophidiomyces ophidiicola]KAI1946374.1 putative component of NuA3 histone acetyltransferase complex [Ophidiomyces ophidiicola]KAI1949988.1 putative component of NuA3 histone acetyltransferase complex [Ophidiomyces ophidiicola]KAI2005560.1 putative component of NuA3 histone acetyltransferase complex [Ophidiomyces ophidiicola]KAI20313
MKRKASPGPDGPVADAKKRALSPEEAVARFGPGLFDKATLNKYKNAYAHSEPYKHGVICPLIAPELLRSVRSEIQEHLSFTEKETDIYKIFQSGDLANLDGLDDASLSRLPSLLKLRDALYSLSFREYLSEVTGAGKLSGRKTDMAINVYTGGCHLLCHDDVIGTRRVSYILYLTDPDAPWKPSYGGALRLFPTTTKTDANGDEVKVPTPDFTLSIPPAFNQLSFFTVQPGESFHDVEEVYHIDGEGSEQEKKERVRMAISGWFHIPQEGEDGYEPGLEEKLAERSSLQQLQGQGDEFDRPQPQVVEYEEAADPSAAKGKGKQAATDSDTDKEFTEEDLDFLLKYMAPSYLTPDVSEQLSEIFDSESSLSLERIFSDKFASRIRTYIESQEKEALPTASDEIEKQTDWKVSRPPHKHRYLYQQPRLSVDDQEKTPIQEIVEVLLPSKAFKKWLMKATDLDDFVSHNFLARRFRRGEDYTLASGYDGDSPRLEFTIGLTPTPGWGQEDEADSDSEEDKNGTSSKPKKEDDGPSVGGYEIYMAAEDDDEEGDDDAAAAEKVPSSTGTKSKIKKTKADPAIYRSAADNEDDGILFSMGAGWNRMSVVLRDRGALKFVKYVSRSAKGDRWDVTGEIEVRFEDEDEDEDGVNGD